MSAAGGSSWGANGTGEPVLVVDLDTVGDPQHATLPVPATLPALVVGVTRRKDLELVTHSGADIELCEVPDPPRPWVGCSEGVTTALEELHLVLSAHRRAATVLCQLLRATDSLLPPQALVAESLAYSTLQGGADFRRWLSARPAVRRDTAVGPAVSIERQGSELRLIIDRPGRHNAFSAAVRDALLDGLAVVLADPSVEIVHLEGRGPSFCAGGDLAEFGSVPDPTEGHLIRSSQSVGLALSYCAARVVAHLHGACIGAGIELAAFAGQVEAAPDTVITLPEIGMGLIPGAGGTVSLPRRIGRERTAWLAITGRRLDATWAVKWGLADLLGEAGPAAPSR
jgi:enoyl-CoA hydratase/carnithine racemase